MALTDELIQSLTPEPHTARVLVVETGADMTRALREILPEEDLNASRSLRHELDRQALIVSRGLLRLGACALIGCEPSHAEIHRDTHGRPFIRGGDADPIDISVSRRRGCAGVVVSRGGRCGIDIEQVLVGQDHIEVAHALRTQGVSIEKDDAPEVVYRRWCCTEAVLKADGCGLQGAPRALRSLDGAEKGRWACGSLIWTLSAIPVPDGYVGMVAVGEGTRIVHARVVTAGCV